MEEEKKSNHDTSEADEDMFEILPEGGELENSDSKLKKKKTSQ